MRYEPADWAALDDLSDQAELERAEWERRELEAIAGVKMSEEDFETLFGRRIDELELEAVAHDETRRIAATIERWGQ
jgi:hypothetical protein